MRACGSQEGYTAPLKKKQRQCSTPLHMVVVIYITKAVRACINVLIESVHKICRQNLSKIKLCDWPNKLGATSWQVLNTTESVGMDRF